MSIATRTGDDGSTSLLYGQRVPKNHPQIEAVGVLDQLNAAIGLAKAAQPDTRKVADLEAMQRDLVALMGEIACAEADAQRFRDSKFARLDETALARLDALVASIEARQPRFDDWATPGKNAGSAALDFARTVARHAERLLVGLPSHGKTVRPLLLQYVNRLSDSLWLMARE
jgi:cob(I)alamin adenosyltransferase